jgi:hypothetical protein
MKPTREDESHGPLSAAQRERVRETLDRILASHAFRNSKQCQLFLRHVVEHSAASADDLLKERSIGAEVFGREADYDTSEDPIVRVRATEVRKRLAQYFGDSASAEDVRFEIPAGSYRVGFHWPAAPQTGEAAPGAKRRTWLAGATLAAVVLVVAAMVGSVLHRPAAQDDLDRFWAPVLANSKPVLIYCGQPVVYFLSRDVHQSYRQKLPAESKRGSYAISLDPKATLRGSDVIPVTDQFVGIGNAHAAALLSGLFAERRKAVEIRYANDLSFSDLRGSPSVLIGAFSNLWTLQMTDKLRFVFEQDEGARLVRDRTNNQAWQLSHLAADGKTPDDYAVVSRLFDSATGQPLIIAGGITQYGTRVAGEFLTDRGRFREALAKASTDWPRRNLQVLLHTDVYKGTPAPPRVMAVHVW